MKILFCLLVLTLGCTHLKSGPSFKTPEEGQTERKIVKKYFYRVEGAQDIFRKVKAGTISLWFYQKQKTESLQDLVAISVGGKTPGSVSRISIRLMPDGRIHAFARSLDQEDAQLVNTLPVVTLNKWHHIAMVVDYTKNQLQLFLNGKELPVEGKIGFKAKETSDTPSQFVTVGAEDDGTNNFFHGKIKEVHAWKRVLTPSEIAIDYEASIKNM